MNNFSPSNSKLHVSVNECSGHLSSWGTAIVFIRKYGGRFEEIYQIIDMADAKIDIGARELHRIRQIPFICEIIQINWIFRYIRICQILFDGFIERMIE